MDQNAPKESISFGESDARRINFLDFKHSNYMNVKTRRGRLGALLTAVLALSAGVSWSTPSAMAASYHFKMSIEDTTLTLVGKQTFHTFSFNSQTPGPLIHVAEGDDVD